MFCSQCRSDVKPKEMLTFRNISQFGALCVLGFVFFWVLLFGYLYPFSFMIGVPMFLLMCSVVITAAKGKGCPCCKQIIVR